MNSIFLMNIIINLTKKIFLLINQKKMSNVKRPLSSLKKIPDECEEAEINTKKIIVEKEVVEIKENCKKVEIESTDKEIIKNAELKKKDKKRWSQFIYFILWLCLLTIVFWLAFYSLRPNIVLQSDSKEIDLSRVLFVSFAIALFVLVFIWIIKLCFSY